jgi:Spy/CpxP family protein refolding chaperone
MQVRMTMRRELVSLILTLMLAGYSGAGQGPELFGGLGGLDMLLQNGGVQKELGLKDDQRSKVKEVIHDIRVKHREDWEKLRDLSQEERREKLPGLIKLVSDDTTKNLAEVLNPAQLKRLKQIKWQNDGLRAFSEAEVNKFLKLTDSQREKIQAVNEEARQEFAAIFQGGDAPGGGNYQDAMKKVTALRKDTLAKGVAVLTPEQKKTWKDLIGNPFEVTFEQPKRKSPGETQ